MKKYILYVNISNLPHSVAKDFVEDNRALAEKFLGDDSKVLVLGVRDGQTRLEMIPE